MITRNELKKAIKQRKNEIKSKLHDCVITKTSQGEDDYVTKLNDQFCLFDLDENGEVAKWETGDNAEMIYRICKRREDFVECLSEIDRKFNIECDDLLAGLKKYYVDTASRHDPTLSRFNSWALKTIAKIKKTSVDDVDKVLEELKRKDAYDCDLDIKRLLREILSCDYEDIIATWSSKTSEPIEDLAVILDEPMEAVRSCLAELSLKLRRQSLEEGKDYEEVLENMLA